MVHGDRCLVDGGNAVNTPRGLEAAGFSFRGVSPFTVGLIAVPAGAVPRVLPTLRAWGKSRGWGSLGKQAKGLKPQPPK